MAKHALTRGVLVFGCGERCYSFLRRFSAHFSFVVTLHIVLQFGATVSLNTARCRYPHVLDLWRTIHVVDYADVAV